MPDWSAPLHSWCSVAEMQYTGRQRSLTIMPYSLLVFYNCEQSNILIFVPAA